MKKFIKLLNVFLIFAFLCIFTSCKAKDNISISNVSATTKEDLTTFENAEVLTDGIQTDGISVTEDGTYITKDEVALYIRTFKKLPDNYITKDEAKKLGWVSSLGNLDKVAKGKSIGGDVFKNYEKVLPVVKGRRYYECDVDYTGGMRNIKRIVYADDFDENIGCIYYTDDHYNTFERLY